MKRMKIMLLALVTAGVMMLAACGDSSQESKQAASEEPAATEAAIAQEEETEEKATEAATEAVTEAAAEEDVQAEEITEEEALAIALKDAGVAEADISYQDVHKDLDDGIEKYDVEFHVGQTEYSYDIDLKSGEILEKDIDVDDD